MARNITDEDFLFWLYKDGEYRVALAEIQYKPLDSESSTPPEVGYYSTYPYVTEPDGLDHDSNTARANISYDDRLSDNISLSYKVGVNFAISNLEITNIDGYLDDIIMNSAFEGRDVKIYLGSIDWDREDFRLIFSGVINTVRTQGSDSLVFELKNYTSKLSKRMQEKTLKDYYLAFSGQSEEIAEQRVPNLEGIAPIILGTCFNVEPFIIDTVENIYIVGTLPQSDSLESISVSEVREQGLPFTYISSGITLASDMTDVSTTVVVSDASTLPAQGIIQIDNEVIRYSDKDGNTLKGITDPFSVERGAAYSTATVHSTGANIVGGDYVIYNNAIVLYTNPVGTVTCDISNSASGNSVADNITYMINMLNSTYPESSVELNSSSISSLTTNFPYDVGIYINSTRDYFTTLSEFTKTIGGYASFTRFGELSVYPLVEPTSSPVVYIDADDILDNDFQIASTERPRKNVKLGYKVNYRPQVKDNLAGSIVDNWTPEYEDFTLNYKEHESIDTSVTDYYPITEDTNIVVTLINSLEDATTEANRRMSLRSKKRTIVKFKTLLPSININIGDTINVIHPRFGFSEGKNVVVLGAKEDILKGLTELEVWF